MTQCILEALGEAHRHKAVHCDIKPANILLPNGQPVLIDFGLTAMVGIVLEQGAGTPTYMAPEQITGGTIDGRSDLFGVGVMLYTMLTGRLPIIPGPGEDLGLFLTRKLTQTPPALAALLKGIPQALNHVVMRALAHKPADRFQSAGEMGEALQKAINALEAQEILAQAQKVGPQNPELYLTLLKEATKLDSTCGAGDLLATWYLDVHVAAYAMRNPSTAALALNGLREYGHNLYPDYLREEGEVVLQLTPTHEKVNVLVYQDTCLVHTERGVRGTLRMVLPLGSYIVILRSALGCTVVPVCLPRLHPWHQYVNLALVERSTQDSRPYLPADSWPAVTRAASPDPLH